MALEPKKPIPRPKFAQFIWERGLELREVGDAIGCSHEMVRRMGLPFGHPRRRVPGEDLMASIVKWSDGEIRPSDFYPPELSGAQTGEAA